MTDTRIWRVRLTAGPAPGGRAYVAAFAWNDPDKYTVSPADVGARYVHGLAPEDTDPAAAGMHAAIRWLQEAARQDGIDALEITADPDLASRYRAAESDPDPAVTVIPAGPSDDAAYRPGDTVPPQVLRTRLAKAQTEAFWEDMLHGRIQDGPVLPVPPDSFPDLVGTLPDGIFRYSEKKELADAYLSGRLHDVRALVQTICARDASRPPEEFDVADSATCMCLARRTEDEIRACMSSAYMALASATVIRPEDARYAVHVYRTLHHVERDDPEDAYKAVLKILRDPDLAGDPAVRVRLITAACSLAPLVRDPIGQRRKYLS